jgi:hypothetical protein
MAIDFMMPFSDDTFLVYILPLPVTLLLGAPGTELYCFLQSAIFNKDEPINSGNCYIKQSINYIIRRVCIKGMYHNTLIP